MLSKIVCDLCNRAFEGVDVFAEHYSKCTGPLNAFQVMMEAARNKASSRKTPATNEMEQSTTLVKASTAISSEAEMDQTSTSVEGSSSLSSGELSELPTTSKALKRPGVIVNRPAKTAKYDDVHCRTLKLFCIHMIVCRMIPEHHQQQRRKNILRVQYRFM
ncbi:hypothetical protein ACLKA7_007007 [Drosophila subpalustris]